MPPLVPPVYPVTVILELSGKEGSEFQISKLRIFKFQNIYN